ncbi:MAG: UPF0182 family protein, partial [Flaviflexus sp.]
LTLPMGDGLLYVQPVYVQASQGTSYPLLQYVLVAFGDQVGFAPTLDEALDQVFDGDSGAEAGDSNVDSDEREALADEAKEGATDAPTEEPTEQPSDEPTEEPTEDTTTGPIVGSPTERLDIALRDAQDAMEASQEAMQSGDWAAYGEAQDDLNDALQRAVDAQQEIDGEN